MMVMNLGRHGRAAEQRRGKTEGLWNGEVCANAKNSDEVREGQVV